MKNILFCLLLLPFEFFAQDFFFIQDEQRIEPLDRLSQEKVTGMSIAVIKNGVLDTLMTFGYADREAQSPVTENTLYQLGSLSGIMMQAVVSKTAQEGLIDLDKPVNDYLTTWKLPNRFQRTNPVTIRELMGKKRGFTQPSKPKGYRPDEPVPTFLQVLNGESPANTKAVKLRRPTKKMKNYSFETEVILQALLEDVYRKPLPEIMEEQLLEPLGLSDVYYGLALPEERLPKAAVGYTKEGDRIAGDRWIHPELGSAGAWATPENFARFIIAWTNGLHQRDSYLSPEWTEQSTVPIHQGKVMIGNVTGDEGELFYGGACMGFRTQYEYHREAQTGFVVLMNSHENWPFMGEVMWRLKQTYGIR
ncbi:MAG: beta-lactamase family protein [Phaeodactylibacter sp.]|nr:beta-lactamase family protein [Phaeodactylibacter sp.]